MSKKKEHIDFLSRNAESVVKIECNFCDCVDEAEDIEGLYNMGWRHGEYKAYEGHGIMCADCYKNRNKPE